MKRKISLFTALLLGASATVHAQVKMGLNPTTINPRAALELDDTTRGFLPPRMTLAQRTAMTNVPLGLTVFVTDGASAGYYFNASALPGIQNWKQLIMNENQHWFRNTINGSNDLSYTVGSGTGRVGIGTSSPQNKLHVQGSTEDALLLENTTQLATGTAAFLDFKTGNQFTARIGSTGTSTQDASLGFYTGAFPNTSGFQKRMTILDGGNVGIGLPDNLVGERLHVDGGHMKLGNTVWSNAANDRLIKFGDADYVSIGEAGGDDRLELTATQIVLKRLTGNATVGINNPSPSFNLDVTGTFRATGASTIGGALTVGSVGIAIPPGTATEKLHIDSGSIKVGRAAWTSASNDRFVKFGAGDNVSIGEAGGDDHMMLTGSQFAFRSAPALPTRARIVSSDLRLYESNGVDSTIVMRGARLGGQGGEIYFVDPGTNERTMTIDGDYNNTGRSRIIVDEVQITGGSDFAEMFDVAPAADVRLEAGMLVSIDEEHPGDLIVSAADYDVKVAGVISGAGGVKPGMMMGQKGTSADGAQPVAITGRVYVKADATREAIRPGDLLTTSALPGHAMKAADAGRRAGAVIGKAMTPLAKGKTGEVLVLLGIQ